MALNLERFFLGLDADPPRRLLLEGSSGSDSEEEALSSLIVIVVVIGCDWMCMCLEAIAKLKVQRDVLGLR